MSEAAVRRIDGGWRAGQGAQLAGRYGRSFAGFAILIGVWWFAAWASSGPAGMVPYPGAVLMRLVADGWSFYGPNIGATLYEAILGYAWGNGLALALAALVLVVPPLRRLVMQLAVISYCLPLIAIGPILTIVFSGQTPMVALAALSCFFTTLVGALNGLDAADAASIDLVRVYGARRGGQLRYVRLFAAMPSIFAALGLAAPAALLGAIIGEWLGSVQQGLGVAMVVSMQQMLAERTWGIAVVCGVLAGAGYAIVHLVAGWLMPWRGEGASLAVAEAVVGSRGRALAGTLAVTLVSLVVVVFAWWAFLRIFDVKPLVGKSPLDVFRYLFIVPAASANRASMLADFAVTLGHAGLGFVAGLAAALLVSIGFVLSRLAEQTLMPLALVLRSVPLVAMTPLIVLVFGRSTAAVAVISGIVVFFPSLVNIGLGLRSGSKLSADLIRAYGGSRLAFLRKVAVPNALPALFVAARISVPGALIGALLAEWLATGNGIGYRMQYDVTAFKAADLWASVALVTLVSLALYFAVGLIEAVVLTRAGVRGGRR